MPATIDTRSAPNPLLVTSEGQTWLVGEEISLRPPAPADAELVQSWTFTRFPISPDRIRARIDAGKGGDESGPGKHQLLIVRRADERPVGSLIVHTKQFPHVFIEVTTDPLFGPDADRWKGEALAMAMRMVIDEWHVPIVTVSLRGDERQAIARLEGIGARQCLRLPEVYARDGKRVDSVMYELLHPGWVARLGDPAEVELPRSGTGQPRPVTPPVLPDGDPPANAVRVGPRVYLRPIQESDARVGTYWSLRETDTNWSNGRFTFSPEAFWNEVKEIQGAHKPARVDFAVCLRDSDGLIGFVGVEDIDYRYRFADSASMMINPAYREAGYGSEAKHLLFDYVFNTLDLHVLGSWVMFANTRSAAALRRQGYTEAGRVHWLTHRDGAFANMVIFCLRAADWRAMPRRPEGSAT